jgi:hypothetical protein
LHCAQNKAGKPNCFVSLLPCRPACFVLCLLLALAL